MMAQEPAQSPTYLAALSYVRRGWLVVPIHYTEGMGCSCSAGIRCPRQRIGKHPIGQEWQKHPARTPDDVEQMFGRFPRRNVGLLLGEGLVAFDLDARHGASLEAFEARYGRHDTRVHRTQGGGWHVLFTYSGPTLRSVSESDPDLGEGVAFKGRRGQQIVAPPSVGLDGAYTLLRDVEPIPLPPILLEAVEASRAPVVALPGVALPGGTSPGVSFRDQIAKLEGQGEGGRNNAAASAAFSAGALVARGWKRDVEALAPVLSAALSSGLPMEEALEVSLRQFLVGHGVVSAEVAEAGRSPLADPDDPTTLETAVRATDVAVEGVRWLWPFRIPLDLCVVFGPPGVGKGFTVADLASRVTTGAPWPFDRDGECRDPRGVLIYAGEERPGKLVARYRAAGADLGRLAFYSRAALGRRLLFPNDLEMVRRDAKRIDAQLLVIDPVNSFIDGKATDAHSDVDVHEVLDSLVEFAGELGLAVILVSHVRKSEAGHALHRLIGSQAFGAVARSAFQVGETDEPGVFAVEHVKSNDGPRQLTMRGRIVGTEVDGHPTARVHWTDEAAPAPGGGGVALGEALPPGTRPRDLARVWAAGEVARRGAVARDELREAIRAAFAFSDGSSLPRQVIAELVRRGALVEANGLLRSTEQDDDEE